VENLDSKNQGIKDAGTLEAEALREDQSLDQAVAAETPLISRTSKHLEPHPPCFIILTTFFLYNLCAYPYYLNATENFTEVLLESLGFLAVTTELFSQHETYRARFYHCGQYWSSYV
jgi:hypothetical protein